MGIEGISNSEIVGFKGSKLECPTVIPYWGGKYELSRVLVPMMPPHRRYFEPFAGGLSVFFRKHKADENILNDIDRDIINLYICVSQNLEKLTERAFWLPKSRLIFEMAKEECRKKLKKKELPNYERAALYYYMIKNAFNKQAFGTFGMSHKSWKISMLADLRLSRKQLDGSILENMDIFKLFDKYSIDEDDFVYLDPPYMVATKRKEYYRHTFKDDCHARLLKLCNNIDSEGGKFMLSYDGVDFIKQLYKDYTVTSIPIFYAGSSKHKNRIEHEELVITNYKPEMNNQITMFKE